MTAVDWSRYRKCPVCAAGLGEPCIERTSFQGGHHDPIETDRPHTGRQLRTGGKK